MAYATFDALDHHENPLMYEMNYLHLSKYS